MLDPIYRVILLLNYTKNGEDPEIYTETSVNHDLSSTNYRVFFGYKSFLLDIKNNDLFIKFRISTCNSDILSMILHNSHSSNFTL